MHDTHLSIEVPGTRIVNPSFLEVDWNGEQSRMSRSLFTAQSPFELSQKDRGERVITPDKQPQTGLRAFARFKYSGIPITKLNGNVTAKAEVK